MINNDEIFTIYVSNIPPQLNKDGLRQLFGEYGEVREVLQPRSSAWAYISYSTFKEAELAMRHLDGARPLQLKVEVARKQEKDRTTNGREKMSEMKSVYQTVPDFRIKDITLPETNGAVPKALNLQRSSLVPIRPGLDTECLYPLEVTSDTFDIYDTPDKYYDSNLMWCRGHSYVAVDGRRQVCMGRGYTWYELPPQKSENVTYVTRVYESRNPQMYQYNHNKLDAEGLCLFCKLPAKFQCHKCNGYYCSNVCQSKDWLRHQHECKPMPQLVSRMENITITNDKVKTPENDSPTKISREITPRLPHKNLFDMNNREKNNVPNSLVTPTLSPKCKPSSVLKTPTLSPLKSAEPSFTKIKMSPKKSVVEDSRPNFKYEPPKKTSDLPKPTFKPMEQTKPSFNKTEPSKTTFKPVETPKPTFNKPATQKSAEKLKPTEKSKPVEQSKSLEQPKLEKLPEPEFSFEKDTFLSSSSFTEIVIISPVKDTTYWVHKKKDTPILEIMMLRLQDEAPTFKKAKPVVGKMYALPFMELWHRVQVLSVNPVKITYSDYGDSNDPLDSNDFREIGDYCEVPPFARKIQFLTTPEKSPKKYLADDVVKVKPMSHESQDGLVIVQTEEDFVKVPAMANQNGIRRNSHLLREIKPSEPVKDLHTVIGFLKVNDIGVFEVHTPMRNDVYSVSLIPESIATEYLEIVSVLPQVCEKSLTMISNYVPQLDEYVVGKRRDNDWIRGKVVSQGLPVKINCCDEGRISIVHECVPLTEQYSMVPAVAVSLELLKPFDAFAVNRVEPGLQFDFTVDSTENVDGKPVVGITFVTESGTLHKAIVRPWVPSPEQKGISLAKIKTGSKVCISTYRSHYSMFVRCLEKESTEQFNRLCQDISKLSVSAKPLTKLPVKGEMVIAKYLEDNNFYRAIVNEVKNDKILITYVDFGNAEETSLKYLYDMPENFKDINASVQKVILKNVSKDVAINREVSEYLNLLTGEEKPLVIMKFEDSESKEVELFDNSESVNKKIQKMIVPSWEKVAPKDESTCFLMGYLPITKLGEVGDVVTTQVLCVLEAGSQYYLCYNDYELMNHILVVMQGQIDDYIKTTTEHYIPRENELCLALYEGIYYRAYCVMPNTDVTTALVMLVDYGNIIHVAHKDIRMITKDFIEAKPLGVLCQIENLLPKSMEGKIPENVLKRIKELIPDNGDITVKITGFNETHLDHTIEIEEIKNILVAEKLI